MMIWPPLKHTRRSMKRPHPPGSSIHRSLSLVLLVLLGVLSGCLPASSSGSSGQPTPSPLVNGEVERAPLAAGSINVEPTAVVIATATEPVDGPTMPTATSKTTLAPGDWMDLPVIPDVSERAREIYRAGLALGNDPHVFAKVGDCQNVPSMFMSIFEYDNYYTLGEENAHLSETIEWFAGSFSRESEAVRRGFNAASVVSPVWADPEACDPGETPLDCELRIIHPSIAIVSLETWWAGKPENYERYVRQILERLITQGTLPILATKADNLEGDHRINQILASLAFEYDIPLWNFWRAIQPLPNHGLMEDGFHLTFAPNQFDDPQMMKAAWPWRNLTALQVLTAVWQGVSHE